MNRHIASKPNRTLTRILVCAAAVMIVSTGIFPGYSAAVYMQNEGEGTIIGEVRDADTGETLPGANVIVKGTTIGVSTDNDGRYLIRRAPAGDQVIVVRYLGFEEKEIPVTVSANERLTLNVSLESTMIEGDEIFVVAMQRGQSRALTRQRESVSIRNIISAEQIDAFADQNITESLSRVVGMGHGGANIRGVGPAASNITMDGQRMGTTGESREVDLSTISSDMVQELDVIKVITPDMDAESLSGAINISTRRPIGGERSLNIRLGGNMQGRYLNHAGTGARTSFSFGDSPSDRFTYAVNFSYQRDPRSSERVSMSWDNLTFQDWGRVDVLTGVNSDVNFDVRHRYGGGVQMTFQPTERSTFHVQSMLNIQERETTNYGTRLPIVLERYTDSPYLQGPTHFSPPMARFTQASSLSEPITNQYTIQLGARHLLDRFDMEYSLGWGHGRLNSNRYEMSFRTGPNYAWEINMEDRRNVELEFSRYGYWSDYPEINRLASSGMDHRIDRHLDNEFTAKVDFQAPHSNGSIKFGTSGIMSFKTGESERLGGGITPILQMSHYELLPNAEWRVFDRDHLTYRIPWMVDMRKARDFYYANYPHFDFDRDRWAEEAETSTFDHNEHKAAAYVMGDYSFGRFSVLGGIRVEHFINLYRGRQARIDREGNFRGADDVRNKFAFTDYFPNAQLVYSLGRMTNIRAAYSRSIGRPTLRELSPYVRRDYNRERIHQGNPDLKPMLSDNLDFLIDHYFMNVGQLSLGFFFKNMDNFVYFSRERIRAAEPGGPDADPDDFTVDPAYDGWELFTFFNGEGAYMYGLEFSWQQNLDFLPGFLSNLGTYANYAYTQSFADIARRHPDPAIDDTIRVPLRDMRPHVVNAGLSYSQGRFSTQVSYQWAAPSIASYGERQWVPEIHQRYRVYFDSYNDVTSDLSMTMRFRISSNIRAWADASNILNHRRINYFYDRDYYPSSITFSARIINIGVRYSL